MQHRYIIVIVNNTKKLQGYRRSWPYIATQLPMENGQEDFWKMVVQQKSYVIVSMQDIEKYEQVRMGGNLPAYLLETQLIYHHHII